jgi:hypothetical protein
MDVKVITVKEIKNLGNYQSITFESTAHLSDIDDPIECAEILKKYVHDALYPETPVNSELPPGKAEDKDAKIPF